MGPTRQSHDLGVTRLTTTVRAVALVAAATALSVGCSSTPEISQSKLEDEISTQLEAEVGTAPDFRRCRIGGLTAGRRVWLCPAFVAFGR